ncbi:MAG: nitronate monooxygenase [Actinomycetia bacterium]|jgi:nitronate monooxygenase|nr:nitronate monooxygenase [Actinomycetes bacterium]
MTVLGMVAHPIVQAPMAGGPSTPDLAAAVSNAGALGFVAAGYLTPETLRAQIDATRALTDRPFGVNVFSPPARAADPERVRAFVERLAPLAAAESVALGEPRYDDDHYDDKVEIVVDARPAVVSFAFGCPSPEVVRRCVAAGSEVWVTVTDASEAVAARAVGAQAVVAQGSEAGAHRGAFDDDDRDPLSLRALLDDVRTAFGEHSEAPAIIAAGGLMTGRDVAQALAAGAGAAQLGTAFLLCPEAGTSEVHRRAIGEDRPTTITRAFTGRRARGIVNAWTDRFTADAPRAYPEIHHVTAPLRAHGRRTGNPDLVNLWAGTGHAQARPVPAADLIAALARELVDHLA